MCLLSVSAFVLELQRYYFFDLFRAIAVGKYVTYKPFEYIVNVVMYQQYTP
jgi:hypothetical protein